MEAIFRLPITATLSLLIRCREHKVFYKLCRKISDTTEGIVIPLSNTVWSKITDLSDLIAQTKDMLGYQGIVPGRSVRFDQQGIEAGRNNLQPKDPRYTPKNSIIGTTLYSTTGWPASTTSSRLQRPSTCSHGLLFPPVELKGASWPNLRSSQTRRHRLIKCGRNTVLS